MIRINILFIALLLQYKTSSFAQNDIKIEIYESTLNKMMKVLGEIKGENEYSTFLLKGTYKWALINPKIELLKDKANFISNVRVISGPLDYTSQVFGNIDVWYDADSNLIYLKIKQATFEIYTHFLGRKIHLKDIDLAEYFKEPISFDGPMSTETDFEFEMPDSTKKTIYAHPSKCSLFIEPKKIILLSELEFTEQPVIIHQPTSIPLKEKTTRDYLKQE